MNRIGFFAALSLACGLLSTATASDAATVVCESRNNSYQACPIDGTGGVRLTRQLSSQGCWQNDTWGYDRNKVWVDRGCRAEFESVGHAVETHPSAPAPAPSASGSAASSQGNAIAAAAVVGLAAAAVIASQHDDHHHKNRDKYDNQRYGDDAYYYGDRYDDYDRYEQRYRQGNPYYERYGYNGYRGDPRWTFRCESRDGRRKHCAIPARGHVEVYRQLSGSTCSHGRSWGVKGEDLWVDEGCRAEFAVY